MTVRKPSGPHEPPKWDVVHIAAFQAMEKGEATPHQQQVALDWLLHAASGIQNLSYWPESDRATAFAEGRRFVGLQVAKLLQLNAGAFKQN